jgi:UDP-N-acetylglucosamine 1-carboxyvinyltransferase
MEARGATTEYRNGYYFAQAPGRLRGGEVVFPHVTVMGTENAMLAATLADGHTTIRPAAQEPEIDDLIRLLQAMGADVERTAPDIIEVEGKRRLRGATHHTIADRIEAGTFAVAAAITGGEVTLRGAPGEHLGAFLHVLQEVGVDVGGEGDRIVVRGAEPGSDHYRATDIETAAYPGLATDLQPPTAVLLSQAVGRSTIHETIYEDRLEWLSDLVRMGAQARIVDPHQAVITGPARLRGAEVEVGDLRAGASLILGALAAEGPSTIHGVHHVRRGYEGIEGKLLDLGAAIDQVPEA